MAADRAAEAALDFRDVGDVIEMTVGEQEQLQLNPARFEPGAGAIGRVEENGAAGGFEQVAVRLEDAAAIRLVFTLAHTRDRNVIRKDQEQDQD